MTSQGPPPHDPDYDPFDTDHRPRGRPVAGPRLPDLAKAQRPDPSQRPAPRPFQPWPKVRPEDVVPPEDNPMRGWRGLGLATLSRDLWPRDARTNPIMAYFTGRKRGRIAEDMLGLSPWIALLLLDALVFFGNTGDMDSLAWGYGALTFLVMMFGAALVSAAATAFHLRRCMESVPVDELILTRMKPSDIVQGLSVRPIAVQASGVLLYTLFHSLIIVAASLHGLGTIPMWTIGYVLLSLALRWYLLGVSVELGAAMSLRANLCLRRPVYAIARTLFDLSFAAVIVLFLLALVGLSFLFLAFVASFLMALFAGMIYMLMFLLFVAGMVMIAPLFAGMLRSMAGEAMEFCYLYPEEWWMKSDENEVARELRPRSLFSAWRPVPGRRRIFARAAVDIPAEPLPEESPERRDPRP